jgi:anthranilate phosphoribosyltransferase
VCDGETGSETWPAMFSGARHLKDTTMDTNRLRQLWQGAIDDEYGTAAVIGTTAIALKLLQKADNQTDAMTLASTMWNDRRLERLA